MSYSTREEEEKKSLSRTHNERGEKNNEEEKEGKNSLCFFFSLFLPVRFTQYKRLYLRTDSLKAFDNEVKAFFSGGEEREHKAVLPTGIFYGQAKSAI